MEYRWTGGANSLEVWRRLHALGDVKRSGAGRKRKLGGVRLKHVDLSSRKPGEKMGR